MEFLVIKGDDLTGQATRSFSEQELKSLKRYSNFLSRVTIYGIPIVAALWLYIAFPNIFLGNSALAFGFEMTFFLFLCPFLHEFLHLIAIPTKLFHPKTKIFIRIHGIKSNISVRVGGPVNREQMIWIALFPFIFITIFPFLLLIWGARLDFVVGLVAAVNFGLSTQDLGQSLAWYLHCSKGEVIYR